MSGKEQVNLLLFNKWDTRKIEIGDIGLQKVISLKPSVIPITFGRHEHQRLKKSEVNIVERLANKLMHFGKRYAKNTGRMGGKKAKSLNVLKTAFEIIHLETSKNPLEVFVKVSVDVAPLRRVDLALRFIAEGVRESTYSNPQAIEEALARELVLASNNEMASHAIKKKNEQERVAMASR